MREAIRTLAGPSCGWTGQSTPHAGPQLHSSAPCLETLQPPKRHPAAFL